MDWPLQVKRTYRPRRDVWSTLDEIDNEEDWIETPEEIDEFRRRVELEIRERLFPGRTTQSIPLVCPTSLLSDANAAPPNYTPRPCSARLRPLVPESTPMIISTAPTVETPTYPSLRHPPRHLPSTVLDTPDYVPSPTQTPAAKDDTTVGRGRRDSPATPVPLSNGGFPSIKSKKDLQSLTKHFEIFSKSVGGSSAGGETATRARGRRRGRGLGMSSHVPSALGRAATLFKGLRFCIVPEMNKITKHKGLWDIVAKHGGQVVLQPDTAVTHVICNSGRPASTLAADLGIQSLSDLPEGTICVQWEWVTQSRRANKLLDTKPWLTFPPTTLGGTVTVGAAARTAEIADSVRRSSALRRKRDHTASDSETESSEPPARQLRMTNAQRTVGRIGTAASSGRAAPSIIPRPSDQDRIATRHELPDGPGWISASGSMQDGLDVMITGVKNGSIKTHEVDEPQIDGDEFPTWNPSRAADFYKCGQSHDGQCNEGPNEWLARKFDELHDLYEGVQGKNDFAIQGYQRAAGILRRTEVAITSGAQAKHDLKFIGDGLADRIDELLSGAQGRAYYEDTEKARVIATFKDIYGVGM